MKAPGHSKPETTWDYTLTDTDRERDHVNQMLERLVHPDAQIAENEHGKFRGNEEFLCNVVGLTELESVTSTVSR